MTDPSGRLPPEYVSPVDDPPRADGPPGTSGGSPDAKPAGPVSEDLSCPNPKCGSDQIRVQVHSVSSYELLGVYRNRRGLVGVLKRNEEDRAPGTVALLLCTKCQRVGACSMILTFERPPGD